MCSLLIATDRLLPIVHSRPGPDYVCYVCAQSGLTVWRQCQWLDMCACAEPVADWRACGACVLIKGLKDQQFRLMVLKWGQLSIQALINILFTCTLFGERCSGGAQCPAGTPNSYV